MDKTFKKLPFLFLTLTIIAVFAVCNTKEEEKIEDIFISRGNYSFIPDVFEHEVNYELEITTLKNKSTPTGSVRNGFAITIEAGDVIDVLTKANGNVMNSADDIWFEIEDVHLGSYTAGDFGYKIACNYITKWLSVPDDATGTFTILFINNTNSTIITMLKVTVI